MANNLQSINLAKSESIPLSDKITNWTITVGRLILILTEAIAIIAFIYRFSLDEQLAYLHSSIKDRQNTIISLKNDESKFRNLQDRLSLAATYSANSIKTSQTIENITKLTSDQIKISTILVNKNTITSNIYANSISSLASFVSSLKNYERTKSLSIDNIENRSSEGLYISITDTLK